MYMLNCNVGSNIPRLSSLYSDVKIMDIFFSGESSKILFSINSEKDKNKVLTTIENYLKDECSDCKVVIYQDGQNYLDN